MKKTQDIDVSEKILTGVGSVEPTVFFDGDEKAYQIQMGAAINWYNATWDEKGYLKAAVQYIKKMKLTEYSKYIEMADNHEIRAIAVLGRLVVKENVLMQKHLDKISKTLEILKEKYSKKKYTKTDIEVPIITVQDKIVNVASEHITIFEGAIDDLIIKNEDFSVKEYFATNEVSGAVAKKISEYFKPVYDELVKISSDEELKEAYSYLTSSQLRKVKNLVFSFIEEPETIKKEVVRKPRAKKVKTPAKLVEKLKFMQEFPELKLTSIKPTSIIGARELYVYNTAKRKFTRFVALEGGLTVKGTTILNFDPKESEMKTIRKPDVFFKTLGAGKRALKNGWLSINGKGKEPNGRISDEIIIVAVNQ